MNKKLIEALATSEQLTIEINNLLLLYKLSKALENQSKQNKNENKNN
jgi:hypothetical protein